MQKNISQQVFLSIKQVLLLSPPHITLTATPADCLVHEFSSPLLPALNWEEKIGITKGPFPWLLLLLFFFFFKNMLHSGGKGIRWSSGITIMQISTSPFRSVYIQAPQTSPTCSLGGSWRAKITKTLSCPRPWRLIAKWLSFDGVPAVITGDRPLFIWPDSHTLSCHMN